MEPAQSRRLIQSESTTLASTVKIENILQICILYCNVNTHAGRATLLRTSLAERADGECRVRGLQGFCAALVWYGRILESFYFSMYGGSAQAIC